MAEKGFRTRVELEWRIDSATELPAETLASASRHLVAAAGAAVRPLLLQAVAWMPRRIWLPLAADRPASGGDGRSI